ncbi:uncharacterized protein LOC129189440 [Dunckerocampus dactyliophorus]|uniref:uncharacterized protein LOC129189440 n=1 Tax=Dunckerocampus dactyliophorus TaxID=161453 RepID=UPI00240623D2|nr:uncharacterized protein LOC129189440 [Dunckerocampus dactyliophorus]
MKATAGLLVLLVTVSQGVENPCDGRKDGAQCYGKLGGNIFLHLMDNALSLFRYECQQNKTILFKGGSLRNLSQPPERFSFTPEDGMMKIEKLERTDSANYTIITVGQSGTQNEQWTLLLFVEAPVTSVHIASKCLSQGEQLVSCSSKEGDNVQYKLTLNNQLLKDADLSSGHLQSINVTLKQHVSGQLACSVGNHVSHVLESLLISTCDFINCTSNGTRISGWLPETSKSLCDEYIPRIKAPQSKNYVLIMAGILSALVTLLVISVAIVVLSQKKKQSNTHADEPDLTYADVRIINQPQNKSRIKARQEVEVEYDQVKFSERKRRTVELKQDGCVYANVRRDR